MALDTFVALVGVYSDVAHAEADYELVNDLHAQAGLLDAYDAAVLERGVDGKVKITRQHETPTVADGVLAGGVGLATGVVVALSPFAAVEGGPLAATAGGGSVVGAVAGHVTAGMRRGDLEELGEHLDSGQAGLVVVVISDMKDRIERVMQHAERVQARQLTADPAGIERDARSASGQAPAGS